MSTDERIDADLVLFDLDDTLCDSHTAHMLRLRHAFGLAADHAGLVEVPDFDAMIRDARALASPGVDQFPAVFERHGITGDEAVEIARSWIHANRLHGLVYFDDAIETLDQVRAARPDRRIGVITNGPDWIQRPKVEMLGIADHVDFVIISGEFGAHKPDPSIFHEALRLGEADAAQAVFIGDSIENDIGGAHGVGIRSIWMNRFALSWPDDATPPHHIATSLADVRRLLAADD